MKNYSVKASFQLFSISAATDSKSLRNYWGSGPPPFPPPPPVLDGYCISIVTRNFIAGVYVSRSTQSSIPNFLPQESETQWLRHREIQQFT